MDSENLPQPNQPPIEKPPELPADVAADASAETPAELQVETATQTPQVEPIQPAASETNAVPRPGLFQRLAHFLFSPETSLGRNLRASVRAFLYGLLMFALGMLFYFILVRPDLVEINTVEATLASNRQQISALQATLSADQARLAALQINLQKSQSELQKAELGASLIELLDPIDAASLAVLNKDGPSAQRNLADARTVLNKLLPSIQAVDPSIAGNLDARLTQVNSDLVDDPTRAQSDLLLLSQTLVNFDKALLGNP
ncbi:MAG TPA: hypothetical protein VKF38_12300 [Anaerolineaceae bacterium]|nr:hypothetical protein [Anaerolineaceae bacterium]